MWHHHGSDTPTSPRAILHHTDAILCTILHTTVSGDLISYVPTSNIGQIMLGKLTELMSFLHDITQWPLLIHIVPKL